MQVVQVHPLVSNWTTMFSSFFTASCYLLILPISMPLFQNIFVQNTRVFLQVENVTFWMAKLDFFIFTASYILLHSPYIVFRKCIHCHVFLQVECTSLNCRTTIFFASSQEYLASSSGGGASLLPPCWPHNLPLSPYILSSCSQIHHSHGYQVKKRDCKQSDSESEFKEAFEMSNNFNDNFQVCVIHILDIFQISALYQFTNRHFILRSFLS